MQCLGAPPVNGGTQAPGAGGTLAPGVGGPPPQGAGEPTVPGAGGPTVNGAGGPPNPGAGGPPTPQLGDHITIPPPNDFEAEAQRVAREVIRNHEAEQATKDLHNGMSDYQFSGICRLGMGVW